MSSTFGLAFSFFEPKRNPLANPEDLFGVAFFSSVGGAKGFASDEGTKG